MRYCRYSKTIDVLEMYAKSIKYTCVEVLLNKVTSVGKTHMLN